MSAKPRSASPSQQKQADGTDAERLIELSRFLKACRDRTDPATFNLPVRSRRRSPGLSRADVASLAGISVDWYTWLEQGRSVKPSVQVLEKLAGVFRLTVSERRYLHSLTNHAFVPVEAPDADIRLMQRLIGHMPEAPALLLRKDWQILAQNDCANRIFGTWPHVEDIDRNLLYLFFTDSIFTTHLRQWAQHAKIAIRQFRAIYATERDNPTFVDLINRLSAASPEFKQWWAVADVAGRDDGRKEFDHPFFGYIDYDYTVLRPAENSAVEVVVFIPRTVKN